MKVIIVGGVAGGATAAARMRRLSEDAEIILFERGAHVSFANCGFPYYLGGVISRRDALFAAKKEMIETRYNIDIRTMSEVMAIDREAKEVDVENHETGERYRESYDKLILATGSRPFVPPMEGVDEENVFTLWTIPDTDKIYAFMDEKKPKKAVVVGGGFIGVEMVENLTERGIEVTLAEMLDQILPPFDSDMAKILGEHMAKKGVRLMLGKGIKAIGKGGRRVLLADGTEIETDMTILSIGVRPNNALASGCGLELGPRGHVVVDDAMQTSDPDIYAVGDVVEVKEPILGGKTAIALAGPANREARAVCMNLLSGDKRDLYPGSIGTSVAKVFDMTAASTGMNEKLLRRAGLVYGKDYYVALIHPMNHVGYYPGAVPMTLKLLFAKDGRVLGAQIAGYDGVDKRIDTIASVMHFRGTIRDLAELELAYAPPYGAAKDPVNFAGFVAENILKGLSEPVTVEEYLNAPDAYTLLDVREDPERLAGFIPGSQHIALSGLRGHLDQLDREKTYLAYCAVGLRGYVAERILKQKGFKAKNLLGGYRTYALLTEPEDAKKVCPACPPPSFSEDGSVGTEAAPVSCECKILDVCGMSCPGPIVEVGKIVREMEDGDVVKVTATDPGFARDIANWCENTGNALLAQEESGGRFTATIRKGCAAGADPENPASCVSASGDPKSKDKTIIVFSGSFDKVMASFIIAQGAAAMGNKVHMFFTFWGLSTLRKDFHVPADKGFMDKMFSSMIPRGTKGVGLSQMNMMGIAPKMMRKVMNDKGISSLEELVRDAAANPDIEMTACQMTMDVMGLTQDELLDGVKIGGVTSMLNDADRSGFTLFIS